MDVDLTRFLEAQAPNGAVFSQVLERYYGGVADPATDRLLAG